jgi:hypothetical protein
MVLDARRTTVCLDRYDGAKDGELRLRRGQLPDERGGVSYTWDNNDNLLSDGGRSQ